MNAHWPPDMVDESCLHEVLGYGVRPDPEADEQGFARVARLEEAVEAARLDRRIHRFQGADPETREFLSYGYKRSDVERVRAKLSSD